MKSPLVDTAWLNKPGTPMRQRATILAALLGAIPVAAAWASPTQTLTAAEVRCDSLEKHPKHIAQVGVKEARLSYSVKVPAKVFESGRPVDFKLTIKKDGTTPAMLSFSTSQQYDEFST